MDKKTVAVLFGGCSTEYEVSLQSAACVIQSINPDKYEIVRLGITREGVWKRYAGPVAQMPIIGISAALVPIP